LIVKPKKQIYTDQILKLKYQELTFREDKKLGESARAKVLKGYFSGTPVAVKKFRSASEEKNSLDKLVSKELHNFRKLRHPNILLILGVCSDPVCIIAEYMDKGSLFDVLHVKKEKLDRKTKVKAIIQVARGINFAHSLEMIHGDLKSKNVLLDSNGNVKVADFGLEKLLENSQIMTDFYSIKYRAPEILQGDKFSTEKVDVYSFGIICWELFSEAIPFEDMHGFQLLKPIIEGLRPPVSKLNDTPQMVKDLMQQCCLQNPQTRPSMATIEKLFVDLLQSEISQVPFNFLCPITLNVMKDPVTSPSGQTYERSAIEQVLLTNAVDPLSQKLCTKADLVPNISLKAAIDTWKEQNKQ